MKSLRLCLALCLLAACAAPPALEPTPTPYPTPVRATYTVQRGDFVVMGKLTGRVTPLALQTAHFAINGHVGNVYFQVGDTVKQGQLLADLTELQDLQTLAGTTRREIRRAQINLEIAQLTLEKYQAEERPAYELQIQALQVELAQMALDEVLEKLGLDLPGGALDALDAQAAQAKLFSPADGVIIAAPNPGRAIKPDNTAFVIGDGKKLEVIAETKDDAQLQEMFAGLAVVILPDGRPDAHLTGQISALPAPYGSAADDAVHIALDQAPSSETYQSGDKVTVQMELVNKPGVLWLPPEAVRKTGDRTFVLVDSDTGPKRIDVEIGLQLRDLIEIVSGLSEGQIVIGP